MNEKQKDLFAFFQDAYENAKRNDESEYVRIKENTPKEYRDLMLDIQHETLNNHLELSYEVGNEASFFMSDIDEETLLNGDMFNERVYEYEGASVYTFNRLQYLNIHNQDEITDIAKEYSCDIQTACAIWYDREVQNVAQAMRQAIMDLEK